MNRRQRRAQRSSGSTAINSAEDIPLARPPTTNPSNTSPKAKTLLEIAAERQSQLSPGSEPFKPSKSSNVINVKVGKDGNLMSIPSGHEDESDEINPWFDTFFFAVSLSALHFTLEVLTVHQYAQELRFPPIVAHTVFIALPTLVLLVHLFHGHMIPKRLQDACSESVLLATVAAKQVLYIGIANFAGCYLIQLTNDRGYYAVMKNAPSIGTIWVWSVLELGLLGALLGVAGPGIYAWWNGYGVF